MNILITGGAGFIGSHLCKRFLERGDFVICVDNFITGALRNIKDFTELPNFRLIGYDISSPLYIEEDIDWVLHFASIASPRHYLSYPIKTLKSGLLGTHNCLGIARQKKAKFFLASTSEVYGDPVIHPQPEEYFGNVSTIGPRACYDESKRAAEALVYAYAREHKVDVRVARIFNIYGPNMQPDDGRVIATFIVHALRGKPLPIYGNGKQTRSFCYIDDFIEAVLRLMEVSYRLPINLGNPEEHTILEVANIVKELTGSEAKIKFSPAMENDPVRRQPDITKAKKLLGWQPRISFREGLIKTIGYFKELLNKE